MGSYSYADERSYKEMMEGKRRYAERRNEEIKASCTSLTPDQHNALAWLAGVRHEAKKEQYCKNAWFNDECAASEDLWKLLPNNGDGSQGEINRRLEEVGLKRIEWSFDTDDFITDTICYMLEMSDEEREEEMEKVADMANQFDTDIIVYLRDIDMEHKTNYCPSGIAQLKNPNLGL